MVKKEYKVMLENINKTLPAIKQSSSNFYKSHSQFMGVMLDVTAITPIRSVKHTLAELDKTRMALEEAHLKMMKKEIELKEKEKKLADGEYKNEFERDRLELEILEIKVNGMEYDDTIVGQGLHTIKTDAIYKEKYDSYSIIPKSIIDKYKQCNFWKG